MSNSSQREPAEEATPEHPNLELRNCDNEGFVEMFEPETTGAFVVVDEYTLVPLDECA